MSHGPPGRAMGRWFWLGLGAAILLVAIVTRTVWSGQEALGEGRLALAQGRELAALTDFREAESWYLPLEAPWRHAAARELGALADRYEASGDLERAVRALSALRAGLFGAESIIHPDTSLLQVVDARLAPLMARWEAQAAARDGRASPGRLGDREAHFRAILGRDTRPNRAWSLLAVLGFALWVFAGWRAAGLGARGWRWLMLSVLGLAGFLLAVSLA